jgi:hypothetical protein
MRPTLIALAALLLAPAAFAQEETKADSDNPNIRYRSRTEIDFEDVSVDGELKKPHGALVLDKRQTAFNPLIQMKADFNQEMVESVNQVR